MLRSALSIPVAVLALGAAPTGPSAAPALSLSPRTIEVGGFAHTARLRIMGSVETGSSAVVVVRGDEVIQRFDRKGRFGFLWVNAGTAEVTGAPAVFLSFSQQPVGAILPRTAIDAGVLDEQAVIARMRIEPPEADREAIRGAYLRLKQDEGSYGTFTGGFEALPSAGGRERFAIDIPWPQAARPGSYRAEVYECRGGAIVGTSAESFQVEGAGAAAGIKRLAESHAWLYAGLAVGVAMSLGFGIDFVLARLRRHRTGRRRGRPEGTRREDVAVH